MSEKTGEVPIFTLVEETVKQRLVRQLAGGIDRFEASTGQEATGVVYVIMSNDGTASVGWITDDHAWPAAAVVGMAQRAILLENGS